MFLPAGAPFATNRVAGTSSYCRLTHTRPPADMRACHPPTPVRGCFNLVNTHSRQVDASGQPGC
jgi:hypothetical protein